MRRSVSMCWRLVAQLLVWLLLMLLPLRAVAAGLGTKSVNISQLTCDSVDDNNTDTLHGCHFSVISKYDLQVTCNILKTHTGSSDLWSTFRTKLLNTLTFRILPPTNTEQQGVYCAHLQSAYLRKWSKDLPENHTVGVLAAGFLSFISFFTDDSYGRVNFTKPFPVAKIYVHPHCRGLPRQELQEDCVEKVIFLTEIIKAAYNWKFTNDEFWSSLTRYFVGELGAEMTHLSLTSSDLLSDIPIRFLTQHLSPGLHMRVLKLANMTIGDLEKPLINMPTLQELNLQDDNITRLSEEHWTTAALKDVPKLLELDVSGNELQELPQALPARLLALNVSRNRMSALNAALPLSLISLNVSFNYIETLPEPLAAGLQTLDASHNRLRRLPQALPKALRLLCVSHNLLTALPDNLPPALQVLQVSHNQLQTLRPELLVPLQQLQVLDLSHNQLSAADDVWLSHPMRLLNLSHNGLRNVRLLGPGNVSHIDASYNQIETWKVRADRLTLVGNSRSPVGLKFIRSDDSAMVIDLGESIPLDCDPCSSGGEVALQLRLWMIKQQRNTSLDGPRVVRPVQPVCSDPQEQAGKLLVSVEGLDDSSGCPGSPRYVAQFLLLLVSVLAVIVAISVLCYHRRYEITYMWHLMKVRGEREAAARRHPSSYKYDAFVCYSSADRAWVVGQLLPKLEQAGDSPDEPALRLCLHERNFPLGTYIADNIISSMKDSRATVIVLSQAFVDSQWCRWELEVASNKVHHLVLLELERMERSRLPRNLRYLMDTRTYLEWPAQPRAQEAKWKQLRAVLADRSAPRSATSHVDGTAPGESDQPLQDVCLKEPQV